METFKNISYMLKYDKTQLFCTFMICVCVILFIILQIITV